VARWPNEAYRLSPRVHLRFRGTSTVHYALPPAAAAARPSRGRGTRALSRLYRHVRHIGALPKGDHRSQPQHRCEGRPPPDDSGRSLQPARWFRHSTGCFRPLGPRYNFFRNAGRLEPALGGKRATQLPRSRNGRGTTAASQSAMRAPSSTYVSRQGRARGWPFEPVVNSLQSESLVAS
jgi:hypothetical protein